MTAPAPVGVVVATRNRAERLATALERLRDLPERPPVVVVDNASRDRTASLVAGEHPEVRLIRLARNRGAVARNDGVAALDTPYVAFSDDDSWWAPGALRTAAGLLDRHPRLGLVAAGVRVGEAAVPDPLDAVLAASPLPPDPTLPGPAVLGFLACAAVVRRSAFLDAGGFHPLLFFGAEETLLAYDLAARGWGVAHCPEVVAHHHPSPGGRGDRPVLVRRNELLTAWLRRPLPLALRRTAALAADGRHDPAARRALGGALLRLPSALRRRSPLPPRVEAAARRVERQREEAPAHAG
ncbi:glycosyltransferase family 2 protein [Streptomyces sp. JJ36]|uniref:glycosyltransferase family 2 protein n=1 Tax=Streptomyces sp. JJ36 TaxID=2736645 RepID=UPI001F3C906A|nr:glycosyltransferase [Streptomyces sp. JJ36]MCF6522669.1 glycosyltransferase [Streptomyces sp. JJ36]